MITLNLPEPELQAFDLKPNVPVTKGAAVSPHQPLTQRVELGSPVGVRIVADSASNDKELTDFLKGRADASDFYLVSLACTFNAAEGESFEKAWMYVNLGRADGAAAAAPSAWSLRPLKASKEVKLTDAIKLSPSLKFAEFGVEGEFGREQEVTKEDVFIQAYGELTAKPFWEFRSREHVPIDGSYRMAMVVEAPKSARPVVSVRLEANVWLERLGGLYSYLTGLPDQPTVSVELH